MRVLVVVQSVEDRGRLRAGLGRLHRMLDLGVDPAGALLRTGRGVDAVIVDARAAGRLGGALRAARRAARPGLLPVLLLAAPGERLVRAELGVTVDDLLRRPVDRLEVEARLRSMAALRRARAGVALDVSEGRQARSAVEASEERFRALVEQSFEPMVLVDARGIVTWASPSASSLLAADRLEGRHWSESVHPDDLERGQRTVDEALATPEKAATVTLRMARQDGSWAWVECAVRNLLEHPQVRALVVNSRDVTARIEAEAALRVAELRHRRLAEVTSDFAFTLRRGEGGADLVLEWASDAFPRITGYAVEAVAAGGGFERVVWHPGDVHLWGRATRRVLAGESAVVEARAVRPAGDTYWLRAYVRPLREGSDGRVVGIYGAGQDVTDRKQLEEERERLASVVDATSDFVALADTSARVLYLNRAAREALGLGERDPGPLTLADCHAARAAERLRDHAIPAARERGRWFGTLAWSAADGREIPVSQVVLAHRGESGRVDFLAVIARDIQEHLDAEAALRRQAEQLEEQAHVLALAHVLVRDPEGRVQRWTRGAEALYGWSAAEATGRRAEELLATELPLPAAEIAAQLEASGRWEGELVQRTRDGRRLVVASHWVLHRDAAGTPLAVVEVSNDITAQKQLQLDLAASREELRALSNHLQSALEEERTRIAREIHDELGQQLTGLKMDVAWLGSRIARLHDPAAPDLVAKTQAMRELVDAAVQAVRRTATALRPLLLDDLGLVAALEWLTGEFTARTRIPCSFAADEPARRCDRAVATALFRIAQEALTNVARHAGATQVAVRLRPEAGGLVLEVRDDGRGIAPDGGGGERSLGVLGMQERARLLGGDVSVSSRPGQGTTVRARVPLARDDGGYSPSTSRMA